MSEPTLEEMASMEGRFVRALESIAGSLMKIVTPPMWTKPDGTTETVHPDLIAELRRQGHWVAVPPDPTTRIADALEHLADRFAPRPAEPTEPPIPEDLPSPQSTSWREAMGLE